MFAKLFLGLSISLSLAFSGFAAESPYDSYDYAVECPQNGETYKNNGTPDTNAFVRCQCTSYVADKLSELLTARYWLYHGQLNILKQFHNTTYYMPQPGVTRWSHARYWRNIAQSAGVGVTGGSDNFHWDELSYDAVFRGDVAWWDKWNETTGQYGHVAFVEDATPGSGGIGVQCVTVSEYNFSPPYEFGRRSICKGDGQRFPDAFLHIDQDHAFCAANPTIGNCQMLFGSGYIADDGKKGYGLGGGGDTFNLKINSFWVQDFNYGYVLVPEVHTVMTGQVIQVRNQVKAENGDTHDHMRAGKNTIEIDFYVREDAGEWRFLQREYIQDTNLPNGATHTEHADYVVPAGVQSVSFKVKIDAEDESYEAHEGDNWSSIQTFTINNNPTYDLTVSAIQVKGGGTTLPAGGVTNLQMAIRNIGTATPTTGVRSNYSFCGPSPSTACTQATDDGSEGYELTPGRDQWEETQAPVGVPGTPGNYLLQGCADYQNAVVETNESNNCTTTAVQVVTPSPDFVISALGLREGTSIKAGTRVHPWCTVTNIGTGPSPSGMRISYYINWDVYRDSDAVDAFEMCTGCSKTEEVLNDNIKLGDKGTRSLRCCADYQGVVSESNESNNCTTMYFTVR